MAAQELAAADSAKEASAVVSAQLAATEGDLEAAQRVLLEKEARVEEVEQALAEKVTRKSETSHGLFLSHAGRSVFWPCAQRGWAVKWRSDVTITASLCFDATLACAGMSRLQVH